MTYGPPPGSDPFDSNPRAGQGGGGQSGQDQPGEGGASPYGQSSSPYGQSGPYGQQSPSGQSSPYGQQSPYGQGGQPSYGKEPAPQEPSGSAPPPPPGQTSAVSPYGGGQQVPPYYGGPPAPPGYAAPSPYPQAATGTDPLAIASLAVGIAGMVLALCCALLGLFAGIGAVATGFVARGRIAQSAGMRQGSGLALAGLICGAIAIIGAIVNMILGAAMWNSNYPGFN